MDPISMGFMAAQLLSSMGQGAANRQAMQNSSFQTIPGGASRGTPAPFDLGDSAGGQKRQETQADVQTTGAPQDQQMDLMGLLQALAPFAQMFGGRMMGASPRVGGFAGGGMTMPPMGGAMSLPGVTMQYDMPNPSGWGMT